MDSKPASSEDTSFLGHLALAITGVFLLGFYLAFGRFVAGSWREFAALGLAAMTYLAGQVVLARVARPRTVTDWRRVAVACPIVGAIAGSVYVLTSTATGVGPALNGLVIGAVHGWLIGRGARKRNSEVRAPAP